MKTHKWSEIRRELQQAAKSAGIKLDPKFEELVIEHASQEFDRLDHHKAAENKDTFDMEKILDILE